MKQVVLKKVAELVNDEGVLITLTLITFLPSDRILQVEIT